MQLSCSQSDVVALLENSNNDHRVYYLAMALLNYASTRLAHNVEGTISFLDLEEQTKSVPRIIF